MVRRIRVLLPLGLTALALAGCSDSSGNSSTSISFTGDNATGSIGADGTVKVDTPVFKGDLKIPKLSIDAKDFEINGVHLYPGSTISTMNVNAHGQDKGAVKVVFTSPADAATVRDWMKQRFDKAGFKLAADGNTLSGKSDDGDNFRLSLTDSGPNASTGTIETGN